MVTIRDIKQLFYKWAPNELAASWDSIGLQIGDPKQAIAEVIISLEVDEAVLAALNKTKACCVITHHPLFFKPLKSIRYDQDMGKILHTFIRGNHQLFSAHTNLDAAIGGVNDCLIEHYNLNPKQGTPIDQGFGKFFDNPNITLDTLKSLFPAIQQGSLDEKPIKRLGFCAGSGHGLIQRIIDLGVDTFITGEITYHDHVRCRMNGIRVLTLGHKESENLICNRIKTKINHSIPSLSITVLDTI